MKTTLALTFAAALAATHPAAAALTFGIVPNGSVTLDSGDIKTVETTQATWPGAFVNIPDIAAGINFGDVASLSGPFDLVTGPISLTIAVASHVFEFDRAVRGNFSATGPHAGAFAMTYYGPDIQGSQSCDQAKPGGIVNCDALIMREAARVGEPASLAMLGSALLGLGLLGRRRYSAE